jgi:hypothetical protein
MKLLFCLLIVSAFFNWSTGQVLNIDRENGQDSTFRRNLFSVNFVFNLDNQKRNLLEFPSQLENDFFLKKKNLV